MNHPPDLRRILPLLLLPLLALGGCEQSAPEAGSEVPSPAPEPDPALALPASTVRPEVLGTTARRLAGLEAEGDAPALPHGRTWTHHARMMDEAWSQIEERHLEAMRSWTETELADLSAPDLPLFYPFAGPDLLSAVQFFPAAESYVLVGLEPPGHVPELDRLGADTLATELERLQGALETIVESGYFVTTRMDRDFAAESLDGVLPMLYIFLARSGLTPVAIRYVALDETGAVDELDTVTPEAGSAVRIDFTAPGDERLRSVYYFSRDVSDQGFAAHPELAAFLRRLGPFNVFMKSASYLLHTAEFSTLGELVLGGSQAILQDDSGLPLRSFAATDWDLEFFGSYTQTLPVYREWLQADLVQVFREEHRVGPLGFAIGYHSQIGGGCLILAERRARR